jgi:hypothetical protein
MAGKFFSKTQNIKEPTMAKIIATISPKVSKRKKPQLLEKAFIYTIQKAKWPRLIKTLPRRF